MIFKNILLVFAFLIHNRQYCSAQYGRKGYHSDRYGSTGSIPIGLITDQYTEQMGIIFEQAIEVVNANIRTPLRSIKEEVNYGDSFQAYGLLCKLLQEGVGGVFGPSSRHTAKHLTTICDAKDVPYFFSELNDNSEAFNLYPHPLDLSKALYYLLNAYQWSRFIFLYESVEYLDILNGLMTFYGSNSPTITVLRYDMELDGNYKTVLRRVRKSEDNRIVVVGSSDTMPEFLRQNKPYASLVQSYEKLEGNDQYEGYGVDLIKKLAKKLGFHFILKDGGKEYGSYNSTTNTTSGMLKEIIAGRAHMAITDLTITADRQQVVDFSIPFMNLGIAILHLKAQKAPPAFFTFMDPFSKGVWWLLGLSFLLVSFSFFILGRLSPSEWDNPHPCIEEPTELVNQFTIGNSLWFTTGALLQQGSEMEPKAISTRTVASIWWFFTLLMVSSYTANLAAFLTIENPTSLIDSIDDLAEQKNGVEYGAKKVGSTRQFFEKSEDPRHIKINKFMNKHQDLLVNDNMDGVMRVNAQYAFLMESTSIEYNTMRLCHLRKVGNALDEKGYGIPMRKNWPYRDKINNALLQLQEQGALEKLKSKWWNEMGAGICPSDKQGGEDTELKMENLMGIYIVLLVGSALAFIYGIVSWIYYIIAKAKHYRVPVKEAFMEELKFAVNFNSHTRILKTTNSLYSRSRNPSPSATSIEPETKSLKH